MRPVEGTQLGNRYTLTSRIAVGGMGEVWKGVDAVLGREVAAKILKDEYLTDPNFLARFRAEAQNMGRVSDPGIAGVYDYGEEAGSPYLVMEYVPGEPLSTIIERSAPLSEQDTLSIVAQAARALGAAHKVGVVHRDIKPGNILMTPDFRVKITDFGIARVADQAPLTKTGQVMGTAQYLAPEQATGKGSGPGSDLYSLGIIAYEALAGRRPFTGDSQVAIAIAQVNQQHPPLPTTVSEPLRRLVDCLLEKKPERRPADAMLVAQASDALAEGDVAGAEALLPQMRPGNAASEALTQVFGSPEASTAPSTQVLPTTAAQDATRVQQPYDRASYTPGQLSADGAAGTGLATDEDPDGELDDRPAKKGRALIWILAIVALIAVGTVLWFLLGGGKKADTSVETPTSATTSAPATVTINPDDFIGLSQSSAEANLQQQGLGARFVSVSSDQPSGTVADVRRGDNGFTFTKGDTVTLEISTGPKQTQAPEPPKTTEPTTPSGASSSSSANGSSTTSNGSSSSSTSSDTASTGKDGSTTSANGSAGASADSGSAAGSNTGTDSGSDTGSASSANDSADSTADGNNG